MCSIFGTEDALLNRNPPINGKVGVVPCNGTFTLRRIIVVAFILEDCHVAQHRKTMCKPARNEQLAVVLGSQFYGNVLSVGRTSVTQINSHVEHGTLYYTHKFCLCMRRLLKMQTTHHTRYTAAFVLLHKAYGTDLLLKFTCTEGFKEISAFVGKDTGF